MHLLHTYANGMSGATSVGAGMLCFFCLVSDLTRKSTAWIEFEENLLEIVPFSDVSSWHLEIIKDPV